MGRTPRAVPTLSRRTTDKLGWWYQGIVDLRDGAVLSRTPSGAAEFIAQLVLKHPERSSAAKTCGRYLAYCGETPHVNERFMLHEEREISEEVSRLVSRIGESGGAAEEIARFNIRLRAGGNRRNLEEWLESQQKRRKVEVQPKEIESAVTILRETLKAILSNASDRYEERRAMLIALGDAFREEVGRSLEPALNAHLSKMPHDSYDEKKTLARYLNAELRRFGLAVRCPKTGRASILQADYGRHPAHGRFQMDNVDDEGKRDRSLSFNELIPLDLIPDDLSRASWGKWAGEVRAKSKSRGRG